jgi:hypothetical protein
MPNLPRNLRTILARTVQEAREVAEEAACKALHALGVDEPDPPQHLSESQRLLRRSLRAQAKQLGDTEDPARKGVYDVKHLAGKIAYDQWHRLLFARLLADNNLLISPSHGVNVTLHDCAELASERGQSDPWDVAAEFASAMLPDIFLTDDPASRIVFAPEDRQALRALVTGLPDDVFVVGDTLGWVYQYWQARRKEEVNRSEVKIGADEIAPVTQLFTEDYMVLFLLHNTLGAWWAGQRMKDNPAVLSKAATEEECRAALALPGVAWEYLRFVKDEAGAWQPATGIFTGWPGRAADLRMLDPSMGSGHFLVFGLPIVVALRQAQEGTSDRETCDAVLHDNLFGLELDPRCTQIAAFNLAFAAWKRAGYRQLPQLNLACCGLGINAEREQWLRLANGDDRLRGGMDRLYNLFQQAGYLGSLLDPTRAAGRKDEEADAQGDFLRVDYHELQPLLAKALKREDNVKDETRHELGVTAQGLAHAAEMLAARYHLVATNVPYLGRGKQAQALRDWCEEHYPEAKADIATCFVERCIELCDKGGTTALVTPQNWLFLGTYKKMRKRLLESVGWEAVVRLGPRAFEAISGEVVNVTLVALTRMPPSDEHRFAGIDVSEEKTPGEKADGVRTGEAKLVGQKEQLGNPDARIALSGSAGERLLSDLAVALAGLNTGDYPRFGRVFWEFHEYSSEWEFQQTTTERTTGYAGMSQLVKWCGGQGEYLAYVEALDGRLGGSWKRGTEVWGRRGIAVSQMQALPVAVYLGNAFDSNVSALVPKNEADLLPMWAMCSSPSFAVEVRRIDQKINVTNATFLKIPFDLPHWQQIAAERYPDGLPPPFSSDPTQWLFSGHPYCSDTPLHVAIARLLGYQWPRQTGSSFPDCPALPPDGLESFADNDGIVCINPIKGEQPAAERIRTLLAASYGADWTDRTLSDLLAKLDYSGSSLEDFLRNGFFDQHCRIFHQRPFIWQIWDGRRDGFSALVNYHKLDRRTLEKLIYTYLGDWITRQRSAVQAGEEGSDARLESAQSLKKNLELILQGDKPYDIFIRWKSLDKQPIGWDPDLNDGVRLNIRPFVTAGVLRKNPKVNWNKDRGKDVKSAPWFSMFEGERVNDWHLGLGEKRTVADNANSGS